jgi:hypothetical protein
MRFRRLFGTLLTALWLLAGMASGAAAAQVFTVRNVAVDVTAETAAAARESAHAQGQAEALHRLFARILPSDSLAQVPPLKPAQVVELVADFEVSNERTSDVRYLADMTVRFNAGAVHRFLRDNGLAYAENRSKPVVVVPVFGAAGTAQLWQEENPWWTAWASRPPDDALVPLIVPLGDLADMAAVTAEQALAGDMDRLGALATRYGAEDVLITQAILGGDEATGNLNLQVGTSRLGRRQQSTVIETFAQAEGETIPALYARAVESVAGAVQEDWKRRNLLRPGSVQEITVRVPVHGLDDWLDIKHRLAGVAGVQRSEVRTLSRAETEVGLTFVGDAQQLVLAMAQSDLDLTFDESDGWSLQIHGAEPPGESPSSDAGAAPAAATGGTAEQPKAPGSE